MPIKSEENEVEQYIHEDKKRINNPPIGLVRAETENPVGKKVYQFDPHLDPQLQWAGKAEGLSFNIDIVSLHVHERIDPLTIIEAVRSKDHRAQQLMFHYFETKENNPSYREAIEFYKHSQGWSNRLVAGDSLLVMNSLLEKEGFAGKVQTIYIDPPYGIKYGSNFQPFVNKKEVKDGKDEDLTQEPEMIKAFRDTWELGIHSYLTYMRNRLLLARELLNESGSCFVQISDENVHYMKELMSEIFGEQNFCGIIVFRKTGWKAAKLLSRISDYIVWFAKNATKIKFHALYLDKLDSGAFVGQDIWLEGPDGKRRRLSSEEVADYLRSKPQEFKLFRHTSMISAGFNETSSGAFNFEGKDHYPGTNQHWKTTPEGLKRLASEKRLLPMGNTLRFVSFLSDFSVSPISSVWTDTAISGFSEPKVYVVQTNTKVVTRCLLMTTDPGDLVLDPTCGSGTTAFVAEQWGRRWITCDTSRVSIALAKQRLMTALFDYYELTQPNRGVSSGFNYEKVQHISLKTVANKEAPVQEVLFDNPLIDKSKKRVTGPFTVEAVPSPFVKPVDELHVVSEADQSVSRSGETLRQEEWRNEILKAGIRGTGGQLIEFSRVETLSGAKWLHADAETKEKEPKRVVISFGPDYAPLEPIQVELALEEASHLFPKPKIVVFAAFQFDPEAAKDIDVGEISGVTLIKVQMNADLLTGDLKKKTKTSESFWLIGQPDIEVHRMDSDKITVEVKGFDYYNSITGQLESGGVQRIAMWMLDTDYDYRSLYPRQVFLPLAGNDEGWSRLAKTLKSEIDPELIKDYQGTNSLPFKPGNSIAIKIIDDRGIESLKVIKM